MTDYVYKDPKGPRNERLLPHENHKRATPQSDWRLPKAPRCEHGEMFPTACDEGDCWILMWECDQYCEIRDEPLIDWPFGTIDKASGKDLEALGFTAV